MTPKPTTPPARHRPTGEWDSTVRASGRRWTATDRKVIDMIDANQAWIVNASVKEIAERADVSSSSIVRVCQRLGFAGIHEVKLVLARDLARQESRGEFPAAVAQLSTPQEILSTVLQHSAQTVLDATHTLDDEVFATLIEKISAARTLLIAGNGTSRGPAFDCAYRLTSLGIVTRPAGDSLEQHLVAEQLTGADVCLCISHTGTTRETLIVAEAAKNAGATVCALTSYRESPLSTIADLVLVAGGPEYGFRHEAMVGRISHMAVIDAIFVAVAMSRPGALDHSQVITTRMRERHTGIA
ncbi:MurR/RpiR family transcriptional regulator [Streptomyces shenzhenensis]|uniref:MurR/RpiR family transcriptional regulator n=1 Tax=Streptomyces shenzhenensis TaxID=943815 RepID=UPI0033FBB753